jgi:hypothetical protein
MEVQESSEVGGEMDQEKQEMLEKISKRANGIISRFSELIRGDEEYNKQIAEDAKVNVLKAWQIEASALMEAIAAISTSIILSINDKGIDINELINDHCRSVNTYLKQALQEKKEGSTDEN